VAPVPYVAVRSVVSAVTTLPWLYSNTELSCRLVVTFCSTAVRTAPDPFWSGRFAAQPSGRPQDPVLERSLCSTDVKMSRR
jgi:hypothetical protein